MCIQYTIHVRYKEDNHAVYQYVLYTCIVKSFGMIGPHPSAKAPHGVVWTAGSAQLKALQAPKISRKSINQELITWGISNLFAPNSPPGLPTLGDDSKFQPKIQSQKNMRKMNEDLLQTNRWNHGGHQDEWFICGSISGTFFGFQTANHRTFRIYIYIYIYVYYVYRLQYKNPKIQSIWTSMIHIWQLYE